MLSKTLNLPIADGVLSNMGVQHYDLLEISFDYFVIGCSRQYTRA